MVPKVVMVKVTGSLLSVLPPPAAQPLRTRASDAVLASAAAPTAVRRESLTVTPLCAWMGVRLDAVRIVRALACCRRGSAPTESGRPYPTWRAVSMGARPRGSPALDLRVPGPPPGCPHPPGALGPGPAVRVPTPAGGATSVRL